jgi:hypothetical protein
MTPEIQDRLDRYVAAFNGGDADTAAEAWERLIGRALGYCFVSR